MKVSDVIARDLKSLEAISFGIGRAFDYPFHYRINLADCFANAQNDRPRKPCGKLHGIH
ncbi:MAG TPA: hypothetical protein VGA95_05760 [Thermodesulfobacteriota bacterium]